MIRLHITAEGQTERGFVEALLVEHLAKFGVYADVRCVLTSKDNRFSKEYRGGMTSYSRAKDDILTWLKEDRHKECRFTTMFDLYALPDDFPGYKDASQTTEPYGRIEAIETAMAADFADYPSFIPYVQLHEFETLILADPQKLEVEYFERDREIAELVGLVQNENPELINDGWETAPSKRIEKLIPEYDKVVAGRLITKEIGLKTLREKCRHFNEWLSRLERLNDNAP